jgi:1,2-dihydroxy-3-keto-5-methylthiopentene dioxygenase
MELSWINKHASAAPTLALLEAVGVHHERLELDPHAYQPSLDRLKSERGYVEQDIVELHPEMENLEAICDKFKPEHLHTDDEVRLVLEGEGIFDLRTKQDEWVRATVHAGDLLVVPANLHHRFFLTDKKHIRCVRLFKDAEGWVAHYRTPNPGA